MPQELIDLINEKIPATAPDESQSIDAADINEVLLAVNEAIDDGGGGSGGASDWGDIGGDITDQTDLVAALDAVESTAATDATTKANAAQAAAIAAIAGTSTTFNGTIKFDKILGRYATVNSSDISGPITVDFAGAVPLGCYYLIVVEDGGGEPSFSADFKFAENAEDYDTTDGNSTLYLFQKAGTTYHAGVLQQGEAVVIPTLDTPTFEVNAISDTEEELSNITFDSDSEVMIIRRATNVGMSANLTTVYTGAPVTEYIDDELTPETTYSYDVQTTAAGFTDSARSAVDSDTTDAAGLTPLSAPGNFTLTADEWGKATAAWDTVPGNVGFSVQIATNAGFTTGVQSATKGTGVLSHQFTGLSPLTTYYGHALAIGNGTTNSNSAYSTADSDTTPAATLSAPTSFAAGTPTSDGAPFTWVDPNSTPANEASFLIQITTTADTGYASVVTTRTPAANATSAAAGTGLTASTGYRARIKAVGNGTSTLDSAYSSEVTFTTAAAGPTLLTFTNRTGSITESPTGTYSAAAGQYMVSDEQMVGDGDIEAVMGASANEIVIFGLDDTSTHNDYTGTWKVYVFPYLGNYYTSSAATAFALNDTGVAYATGDKWGLYRVGSTIKARKDSGSGYVDIHTFTGTYSGTMNAKVSHATGTTTIKDVKGEGFA